MAERLEATHLGYPDFTVVVDRLPDYCPVCLVFMQPKYLHTVAHGRQGSQRAISALLQCTRLECGAAFLATYTFSTSDSLALRGVEYFLRSCVPQTFAPPDVTEEIKALSPNFLEIYSQALKAEAVGLDQLVGIGLPTPS